MARIRTIKPEFPHSESMGRVSRDARLTFIELWTLADDDGRLRGSSRMLASLLFPYDDDAPWLMDEWLAELERERSIIRYEHDGASYVQVCNWLMHQKIDKPSRSKLPGPPGALANPREDSSGDQGSRIKDQGPGGDLHARDVPRGTSDAGTALTEMPSAEDTLAELRDNWRDVTGCEPTAMREWLAHWSLVHGGKEMPIHQRIATAKLLSGLGDPDTQIRAVAVAVAAGWKALRPGDGRKPPARKGDVDPGEKASADSRAWADLRARAKRIGYRAPTDADDVIGYRTLVERAESSKPLARGPITAAELLRRTQ